MHTMEKSIALAYSRSPMRFGSPASDDGAMSEDADGDGNDDPMGLPPRHPPGTRDPDVLARQFAEPPQRRRGISFTHDCMRKPSLLPGTLLLAAFGPALCVP